MLENNKNFISLGTRVALVMILAAVVSVCLFFGLQKIGSFLAWRYYMDSESVENRKVQYIEDFREYVKKYKISASDSEQLRDAATDWSSGKAASIVLYVNNELICSEDWFDFSDDQNKGNYDDINDIINDNRGFKQYMTEEARSKYETLLASIAKGDAEKHPIEFKDGTVFATIVDRSGNMVNAIVSYICAMAAAILFFTIVINCIMRTVSRISTLARNVRRIESGERDLPLVVSGNDEISSLASDVDSMRDAILENARNEHEAWKSNSNLVTAMSHDLRTPLTVLLGYIDLMEMQNKDPVMGEYITTCRNNAERIKLLSDDLFRYNLAFGDSFELNTEECVLSEVVGHMIGEHVMLCETSGYSFKFSGECPSASAILDVAYFGRVIDNLFSNIQKYADIATPVEIAFCENGAFVDIIFKNKVKKDNRRAESNKIGNKTCDKIMRALGGVFTTKVDSDIYIAKISVRIIPPKKETHKKGQQSVNGNSSKHN